MKPKAGLNHANPVHNQGGRGEGVSEAGWLKTHWDLVAEFVAVVRGGVADVVAKVGGLVADV